MKELASEEMSSFIFGSKKIPTSFNYSLETGVIPDSALLQIREQGGTMLFRS
jgi:hypothetical protein